MANIIKKFINNFNNITDYYNFLVEKTKRHEYVEITNEWLIDNYYLLAEHKINIDSIKAFLKKNRKTINENYYILKNIASKKNYNISFKYIVEELKSYQKENKKNFTYKELECVYPLLILIYTERLNSLCREEYKKLVDKEDVELIVKEKKNNLTINSFISESFDLVDNKHYIFEINNQLSRIENNGEIFKSLNEYLNNNNISLKELVNEEYQNSINNNVLMSNIFSNLKEFFEFSKEKLFEKVSRTERLLLTDEVYKEMTDETKSAYRRRLLFLARKHHSDEYSYLEKTFSKDEHIGFKLFKEKSSTLRAILYKCFIAFNIDFFIFFICIFY